jgi:hypothetical protein
MPAVLSVVVTLIHYKNYPLKWKFYELEEK